ncbi:transposable element Tcb2 transposase [Trichonephila clavipes]|nr:transposable element Tcb2 transposase [Trichonephila clavipes]
MPRRRKGVKFEQISEFERGRIVGFREAGLSYSAVATRVQCNSSTVMRVSKQWMDEGRTARKSGSGPRNVTSAREDRRLRGRRARFPLYRIPLRQKLRHFRLQWANVHRSWRTDWQQVVFSYEFRFSLWHHDGRIRVRRYDGERHIPECIIERHSKRTSGVMVWGVIAYHERSQLLQIVGPFNQYPIHKRNLTAPRYSFPLLSWSAYSPDMPPIQHVRDIVGRRLARDLRPVASTDKLWLRIQTIKNTLPQADIQNLFNSMPRRVAALIAARGAHTKY